MSHISTDLLQVYNTYFQKPYRIDKNDSEVKVLDYVVPADYQNLGYSSDATIADDFTKLGIKIKSSEIPGYIGREIFLPVGITVSKDLSIVIPCATIRVTNKKTIIRTELSERSGTVKEQFNIGDYVFTIKGVLIGKDYKFPEDDIRKLTEIYESNQTPALYNALAELFMKGENRIAIESLEFPEVEGKHIRFKPFVLVCETDFIDTLILK